MAAYVINIQNLVTFLDTSDRKYENKAVFLITSKLTYQEINLTKDAQYYIKEIIKHY